MWMHYPKVHANSEEIKVAVYVWLSGRGWQHPETCGRCKEEGRRSGKEVCQWKEEEEQRKLRMGNPVHLADGMCV